MDLVDWAARWTPVPDDRPAQVWLPEQPTPAPAATGGQGAAVPAATREPRSTTLTLTPQHAVDLPLWLPHVLAQQDLRPGDRVAVDLADLQSVHLTGLELLMSALWRRVGTDGEVLLTGGARGLRAQLDSLDITPASCRAAVYGGPPAAGDAPGPVPVPVDTGMGAPARGGRLPLVHANPRAPRLLAVTRTTHLVDEQPRTAHCSAPPQTAVLVPVGRAARAAAEAGCSEWRS